MAENKERDQSLSGENSADDETIENSDYPSACFLLDTCYKDYQRVLDNYNRIYDKINVALAFAGVTLTIMYSTVDFSFFKTSIKDLTVFTLSIVVIKAVCLIAGLLITLYATLYLLHLMKSKGINVFNSVDIRNEKIYDEKESHAALWLIAKYTSVVNEVRPIINEKQIRFDLALKMISAGVILYAIYLILQKGGL